MAKIELRILDDKGNLLEKRLQELDIGSGSLSEIEQAVQAYEQSEMKQITRCLLEEEQSKFIKSDLTSGEKKT
ncbi:MAG: hypothetical protein AAF757_31545 [Cyanobacteria bacterium P01_D01_bin.116]